MIRPSAEDYLETILLLSRKNEKVRGVDIAAEMGFSKPSVSVALKKLLEAGLVKYSRDNSVLLTEGGVAAAERVLERHATLTAWFVSMGVEEVIAAQDACKLEHILSEETYAALRKIALS